MKILVTDQGSYIHGDIVKALENIYGSDSVNELIYEFCDKNIYDDTGYESEFLRIIQRAKYDVVISTNFYPIVARLCNDSSITYISWSYDTPINVLPCDEMRYETNYIFLFDKIEMKKYRELGYDRFFHMTLAVDTEKYEKFRSYPLYSGDVAFVGKLYRSKLPAIRSKLSNDLTNYIDELVSLQMRVTDRYVVNEFISQPIIDEINKCFRSSGVNIILNKQQLSYAIAEYVSYIDRIQILELLGKRFDTHLYTYDIGDAEKSMLKDVRIHGPLDYHTQLPSLYKTAKINLNSSLKAAQSAIPLRVLDILACKGFLISNAQPEIVEYFENGVDLILYNSMEELIEYTGYYLEHDDERRKIAYAGYIKVKKDFTYEDRLKKMFAIAGVV